MVINFRIFERKTFDHGIYTFLLFPISINLNTGAPYCCNTSIVVYMHGFPFKSYVDVYLVYGSLLIFRKDTITSHYLEYLIGILRKFTQKIAPDLR